MQLRDVREENADQAHRITVLEADVENLRSNWDTEIKVRLLQTLSSNSLSLSQTLSLKLCSPFKLTLETGTLQT